MRKFFKWFSVVMLSILVTGCASSDEHAPAYSEFFTEQMEAQAFFETEATLVMGDLVPPPISSMLINPHTGGRMLVYEVSMTLQTQQFLDGMRILLNNVNSTTGFVEYARIRGTDIRFDPIERQAVFTFRVPTVT